MTTSAERKRAQRQRDKANGIITITLYALTVRKWR